MRFSRIFSTLALSAAAASSTLVACGSAGPSSQSSPAENLGSVKAAIVAVGPNNIQYSLPPGTQLELIPAGADAGSAMFITFDTTTMVQTFSVPAGPYTANLIGPNPWALTNLTTMSSSPANLLDAQPYEFTVTANQTTALAFHFQLAGVGDVTFSTGTLSTSLSVASSDGGAPTSGNFTPTGINLSQMIQPNADPTLGPLATAVQAGLPATFSLSNLHFNITGPFAAQVDSSCATIQLTSGVMVVQETLPDAGANSSTAVDLFNEALVGMGSTGFLCVYDPAGSMANFGVANGVYFQFDRNGQANSQTVKNALPAMAPTEAFVSVIVANAPTSLYDGKTAHLASLASATTLPVIAAETGVNVTQDSNGKGFVIQGNQTGSVALQLTP
jgi:hypothetical protein